MESKKNKITDSQCRKCQGEVESPRLVCPNCGATDPNRQFFTDQGNKVWSDQFRNRFRLLIIISGLIAGSLCFVPFSYSAWALKLIVAGVLILVTPAFMIFKFTNTILGIWSRYLSLRNKNQDTD